MLWSERTATGLPAPAVEKLPQHCAIIHKQEVGRIALGLDFPEVGLFGHGLKHGFKRGLHFLQALRVEERLPVSSRDVPCSLTQSRLSRVHKSRSVTTMIDDDEHDDENHSNDDDEDDDDDADDDDDGGGGGDDAFCCCC